MIGKILVGLGGTRYTKAATETAIEIASRYGASVTGVTVVNLDRLHCVGSTPIGAGWVAKELGDQRAAITRQAMHDAIDQFAAHCEAAGVDYEVKREERDEPFDFLLSQARYHDLAVLGLQAVFEYGVPGVQEEDPGLTLVRLITGGVRPIIATPGEHKPVKRVFAAYSGSVESAATLRKFIQLRPYPDITLRIATFGMDADRGARLLDQAAKYCRSHGVEAETEHYAEPAAGHILQEAGAWNSDLIVLGNSHRHMLLKRMLGSTAMNVIRHAEHPLFLGQ